MTLPLVVPRIDSPVRRIGATTVDFDRQALVMAIVNRTPDSFYDGGATYALDAAVRAGLDAAEAGADWIDIGGVPFSPDTPEIDPDTEAERVVPVVERIAEQSPVVMSIDTTVASVARRCLAAGAAVINDTSGFHDPDMAGVIAEAGATVVITHSIAAPHRHSPRPQYADVLGEIRDRLLAKVDAALTAGIPADQIVIDPGHDLNKNTLHTLELTRDFAGLTGLGHPVLAAVSRKDFIGETLGRPKPERLAGSLAAAMWCLCAGARIIRMHDVAAAVDTVRMFEAIAGWRRPVELRHNM